MDLNKPQAFWLYSFLNAITFINKLSRLGDHINISNTVFNIFIRMKFNYFYFFFNNRKSFAERKNRVEQKLFR